MQPVVYLRFFPEIELEILHPFEVRDDNSTRVRQNIRDDDNALLRQDRVRFWRRRAVRPLDDIAGTHSISIAFVDLALESSRNQEVDRKRDQLVVRDVVTARRLRQR